MNTSMTWMGRAVALALFSVLCLAPSLGHSQITPRTINYQGSLTNAAGNPITGSVVMTFSLYNALTAPTPLWQEKQSVPVVNGAFSVVFGTSATNRLNPTFFDRPLYLGIQAGADPEMVPRQALAAVGYSFRSLMPSGTVIFFDGPACPAGWAELTTARGRALVGVPSGGSLNGTVGTALGNLENRPHAHSVNPAPVSSTGVASHTHVVNPPSTGTSSHGGHAHSVNPPARLSTSDSHNHSASSDTHNHVWGTFSSAETWRDGNGTFMFDYAQGFGMDTAINTRYAVAVSGNSTGTRSYDTASDTHGHSIGSDTHNHSTDILAFNSASGGGHNHAVDIGNVGSTAAGSHGHSVDVGSTGSSSAGTQNVMPYLQLRVCRKS